MKEFIVNGTSFIVSVIIKKKNLHCYMHIKDGIIVITSFKRLNDKDITKLLEEKYSFLVKALNNFSSKEEITYLGKTYAKVIEESSSNSVRIEGNNFIVSTKSLDSKYIDIIIHSFYLQTTKEIIPNLLEEALDSYKDDLGFKVQIEYKYLKSCYGRCYPSKKMITFSGICAYLTQEEIRYVIYHELAHFKFRNHQKCFYDYLVSHLPNALFLRKSINKRKK